MVDNFEDNKSKNIKYEIWNKWLMINEQTAHRKKIKSFYIYM
jgi:hypothetical protein